MWLKIDDGFHCHRKVRKAARGCPASLGLWLVAGSACADAATEGVVSVDMLDDCLHDAGLAGVAAKRAVAALVGAGMWHDTKTIRKCDRCQFAAGRLPAGCFYFHDWLDYQYTRDEAKVPEVRWKKARAKALHRDHRLKQQILDRDLDRCRYCAVRVDFRDRVGPGGGTYDHVDPSVRENTLWNVVVSCRDCNITKADRTPDEAGMVLLDPPAPDLPPASPRLGADLTGVGAGPSHTRAPARGRDGLGRDQAPARSRPDDPQEVSS
jgi:5-methylcytosine-specific restriction endonuclease McrA